MPSRGKNRRTSTSGRRSGGLLWLSIGMILGGIAVGLFFVKLVVPRTLQNSPLVDQEAQNQVATGSVKPRFDFYTMLPEMEVATASQPEPQVQPHAQPIIANPTTTEEQTKLAESLAALQPKSVDQTKTNKPAVDLPSPLAMIEQPAKPTEVKPAATPAVTPPKQPVATESYMLQLASFKSFADADQLKAKLSLLGFNVSIQTISATNGEQWFRVRTGPYNQLSQAEQDREQLKHQQINSILLKLRG